MAEVSKACSVAPIARCFKFHPEIQQRDAKAHNGRGFLAQSKGERSSCPQPRPLLKFGREAKPPWP